MLTHKKALLALVVAVAGMFAVASPSSASVQTYTGTIQTGSTITIGSPGTHVALNDDSNPPECAEDTDDDSSIGIHVETTNGNTTIGTADYNFLAGDLDVNADSVGDFQVVLSGVDDTHSTGDITIVAGAATDVIDQHVHVRATIYNCAGTTVVCQTLPITVDLSGDWHPTTQDSVHGPGTADVSGHTTVFTGPGCNSVVRTFLNNKPVTANFILAVA